MCQLIKSTQHGNHTGVYWAQNVSMASMTTYMLMQMHYAYKWSNWHVYSWAARNAVNRICNLHGNWLVSEKKKKPDHFFLVTWLEANSEYQRQQSCSTSTLYESQSVAGQYYALTPSEHAKQKQIYARLVILMRARRQHVLCSHNPQKNKRNLWQYSEFMEGPFIFIDRDKR